MADYDHVVLLLGGTAKGAITARYSRVAPGMNAEQRWSYFERQVAEAFGHDMELLAVIADEGHEHPLVTVAAGEVWRDDRAHMP